MIHAENNKTHARRKIIVLRSDRENRINPEVNNVEITGERVFSPTRQLPCLLTPPLLLNKTIRTLS